MQENFTMSVLLPVIWSDMDAFGHVNNAVYFSYFEACRIKYFEKIGFGIFSSPASVGPILASTSCRFRFPLVYPDTVIVKSKVTELLADRFTMRYVAFSERHKVLAAEGEGIVVAYDYSAKCKALLPPDVESNIKKLEKI